jgi:hypothetical protein
MRTALFTLPLLAATLLLSSVGCAPQEDLASTLSVESSSSYQLDGQLVRSQAEVTTSGMERFNERGYERFDLVSVSLTTRSQPAQEYPCLILDFERPVGQVNGPYHLKSILYLKGNNDAPVFYDNVQATLTKTGHDLFSGTFSATSPNERTITKGIFTNARVIKDDPL